MHNSRLAILFILIGASVLLSTGCDSKKISYPRKHYFEDRAAWQKIVRKWRKEYSDAYIEMPRAPHPRDVFSEKLRRRRKLRVAVVGVVKESQPRPSGTASEPGYGNGYLDRVSRMRWSTRTHPAARIIDPRQALLASIEMDLSRNPNIQLVNRRDLKRIFDERDLQMALSGDPTLKLKNIKKADAIIIVSASELEYLVYSSAKYNSKKRLAALHARRAKVRMRMIDVQTGDQLWAASVTYEPNNYIRIPIIIHPAGNYELPEVVRGLPKTDCAASDAAFLLIKRLRDYMARRRPLSLFHRRTLSSHQSRDWYTGDDKQCER